MCNFPLECQHSLEFLCYDSEFSHLLNKQVNLANADSTGTFHYVHHSDTSNSILHPWVSHHHHGKAVI